MSFEFGLAHLLPAVIGALELLATARYLQSVLRGETRPCRTTWLIWAPLAWLTVISSADAGAGATLAKLVTSAIGVTAIAIVALSHGIGGRKPSDLACIALTVAGLSMWAVLRDPVAGLLLFLSADIAGAVPTLRAAWRDPHHETCTPWLLGLAASLLNLALVDGAAWAPSWQALGICSYPVYLVILNGAMAGLAARPRLIHWTADRRVSLFQY